MSMGLENARRHEDAGRIALGRLPIDAANYGQWLARPKDAANRLRSIKLTA